MRLRIDTPLEIVVDEDQILSFRGEDESGAFGILPGHAAFLTSLSVSVVRWTRSDQSTRCCAVRRGVLTVMGDRTIAIATREAVVGNDIETLEGTVVTRFRSEMETERSERVDSTRLQLRAIRQIMRHLQAGGQVASGPLG
ncbi:F0F1 ATP synthase subunit epsilon [Lichenihabitans psoromatis]|uniref:F0F1 ATP synthase subunit epsilon n=1 Tax=Lichenihabitans psoromatis TaxID=2528642 RepID=UPI0010359729|nr:F0F1 ATP synthase subunit epsilon [Lichenihabitans psoromatis]